MSWRPFGSDLVWSTVVYRSTSFSCYFSVQRIGCFKDSPRRAIPILEGKSKLLQGNYKRRKIAIRKCAMVAVNRGYNTFSVQDGGQCFSGPRAQYTFAKYGRSNRCRGGKGGPWANDVYRLTGAEPTLFIYCSFLSSSVKTGFVWIQENLESPGILFCNFPGLGSLEKRLLVLERFQNLRHKKCIRP